MTGQFIIKLEGKEQLPAARRTVTLRTVTNDLSVHGVLLTMSVN